MTRAELPEKEVKKMTREEAISKHRKMWRWLAENPGKMEEDYLETFDPGADLVSECYLCEYTYSRPCNECPLEWPGGVCSGRGRLFTAWSSAMNRGEYDVAAEIAKQIAELPEKELK